MYDRVLVWRILCLGFKSLLCVFAVRGNWETRQRTTERYMSDPLHTETHTSHIPEKHT